MEQKQQNTLDRTQRIEGALTAEELNHLFNLYWKFFRLEIPWLGQAQVNHSGFVEGNPGHGNDFYVRVMTVGGPGLGGDRVLAQISYRLAAKGEENIDFEGPYTIDKSSAYKTRRTHMTGSFTMASAKIFNNKGAKLLELFRRFQELDFDTSTLGLWSKSGRPIFVRCDNHRCERYDLSRRYDNEDVQKWVSEHLDLSHLREKMVCSSCRQKKAKVSPFSYVKQ